MSENEESRQLQQPGTKVKVNTSCLCIVSDISNDVLKRCLSKAGIVPTIAGSGVTESKVCYLFLWISKYIIVRTCAYQGVWNVRFSEKLMGFVFLRHPFWYSPFCLVADVIMIFIKY